MKANPRSKVYRGEREYGERREMTTEAGKIRVKIAPDGQYLSISGAEVVPILKKVAEKHGRYVRKRGAHVCIRDECKFQGVGSARFVILSKNCLLARWGLFRHFLTKVAKVIGE